MMTKEQAEGFIQVYEKKRVRMLEGWNIFKCYNIIYEVLIVSRILEIQRKNDIFRERAFYADELSFCESDMKKKVKKLGVKKFEALKQNVTEDFKKFQETIGDCGE